MRGSSGGTIGGRSSELWTGPGAMISIHTHQYGAVLEALWPGCEIDCSLLQIAPVRREMLEIHLAPSDIGAKHVEEAPLSDSDPIVLRPRQAGASVPGTGQLHQGAPAQVPVVCFDRRELDDILAVYGRKVAAGEWRDYAIDIGRDKAVFSIFRRSSECPLYRIEKNPKLARKQGAYSVIAAGGLILKRGHDLRRVLGVLERRLRVVGH